MKNLFRTSFFLKNDTIPKPADIGEEVFNKKNESQYLRLIKKLMY